jgi:hypothetical protein
MKTLLASRERRERIWAVIALGFLGDPAGGPMLRALVVPPKDTSFEVARKWSLERIEERRGCC